MSLFFTRPDAHISLFHWGRIRVSGLRVPAPSYLEGVRAVYVADVHLRAGIPDRWLKSLLGQIAAEAPDLLLLGGDYGESPEQQRRFFAALGDALRPPLGAFGVPGNNDRECFPEPDDLRACMARGGVRLLLNECALLPREGGTLMISGVDEEKYGCPRPDVAVPDCPGPVYRLLLEHMPRWPQPPVDLALAGHTHGGQLNALGLTPFSVGFEAVGYAAVKGVVRRGGTTLLVSRGIGYSRLPLRVGVYPEIHRIEFVKPNVV